MKQTDTLCYENKNGYDLIQDREREEMEAYCSRYCRFLDQSKTEREAAARAVALARQHGFRPYEPGAPLSPGDKIYRVNRDKGLVLAVIGARPLSEGARIAVAHADSPRLDLKPNPLREEELALLRTHYYGGIKKYQWTAVPLALHGVFCLKDGSVLPVCIGEDPDDPVFCVTDLLPHLANKQMDKKLSEGVSGEDLQVLFGSEPVGDPDAKHRIKAALLASLNERFGVTEADFLSAELALVPAAPCREVGLDRSLLGAYGHDDRVCVYAELEAILNLDQPEHTAVCLLADKEEIGSVGVSGMQSRFFDFFMEDLCGGPTDTYRRCLERSLCLSADVCNALDPLYADVSESQNSARLNHGVAVCKYTGSRGKAGSSDASGETVAKFRSIFDASGVVWQMTELGKVDQGGGGTVAGYMANRNIDTLDVGVALLSMHAPMEIAAKLDCYMLQKAAAAFYRS